MTSKDDQSLDWSQLVSEIAPHEALGLLRRRLDLSQNDVTIGTGIGANYISMYERGSKEIPSGHLRLLFEFYREKMAAVSRAGGGEGADRSRASL